MSLRHNRLLGTTHPIVVVACDHGEFDGPQPGLDDPLDLIRVVPDSIDAILMSPGTLTRCGDALGHRGAPLAIVRLNWNTVYCFGWQPVAGVSASVLEPAEALALGADAALISLTLNSGSEQLDAANVQLAARLIQRCRAVGLPSVGEYFPTRADDREMESVHDEVRRGARILAELGADAVKTFLEPEWHDIVQTTPAPILALGAQRDGDDASNLAGAARQIATGARGLVYGRKVFQADDPAAFMHSLTGVVRQTQNPTVATS